MEIIKTDNRSLAYKRLGRQGRALVLIHGFPLDHSIWGETAALLAADFDVIMPDLPGFGTSERTENPSMLGFARGIASLLDHLNVDGAVLAGHSMGGYVALAFATVFPQRLAGLGLVSSQVFADTPERRDGRYKTAEDVLRIGKSVVIDAMSPKFSSDRRAQTSAREIMQRQQPLGIADALRAMAEREDSKDVFSRLTCPVVIAHGSADELIPFQRAGEAKEMLPAAHLIEIPGAGHLPMVEAPEKMAAALRLLK